MKIASIDIGSNTVLLLIAEVRDSQIFPIINEYRMPRISNGLSKTGVISEKSKEKLFEVLSEYAKIILEQKCEKVLVNGTQALRIAKNSESIKSEIKSRFGFNLNIIHGEQEAFLSFKGAISSFNDEKNYTLIDIGGASTEIVLGNRNKILFRKSFPIGAVTGKENFLKSNPAKDDEIRFFENELNNLFAELKQIDFRDSEIIAVAGTPTTLTALKQKLTEYSEEKVEKAILTLEDLHFYKSEFKKLSYSEIAHKFAPMISGREDVILVGTIILQKLVELMQKEKLFVSGRGLRYGAILESYAE